MATIPTLPLFTSGIAKSGQFNRLRDAIAFWQNPPSAMVVKTTAQDTTTATYALVTFETTSYDSDTIVTSTSRLTAKTAGRYSIGGKLTFAANTTGIRRIQVRKNAAGSPTGGTLLISETVTAVTTAGVTTPVSIGSGPEFQLGVNDYIEAFAYQNSDAPLALTIGATTDCILTMRLAQVAATTSGDEGTTLPGALVQTLLTTEDLNAVTTPGNYLQATSADATLARNYPEVIAGHLEVHGGANANYRMQRYTTWDPAAPKVYARTYQTSWGAWVQVHPAAGGSSSGNQASTAPVLFRSGSTIWSSLAPNGIGVITSCAPSAETTNAIFAPVSIGRSITFQQLAINVATAGGDVRVGIWNGDATGPTTVVADSGVIDCSTTGIKTVTLGAPVTLPPGTYWVGWVVGNIAVRVTGWAPADRIGPSAASAFNVTRGFKSNGVTVSTASALPSMAAASLLANQAGSGGVPVIQVLGTAVV